MMDPERPDLSAFEWEDTARWDRMVKHIMWRSSAELERRRLAGDFGLFDGLLAWARAHGLSCRRLDLKNSGDTIGPRDRVVGYGAYAVL